MTVSPLGKIAAFLVVPAILAASDHAVATEPTPAVISVSATGRAMAEPDMAIVNLTVAREAKTARAALDASNQAMNDVLKSMTAFSIEERDLQTSNFNIQPRYFYPKSNSSGQKAPRIIGYTVSNSLSVRIRDLSQVGDIIDKSVSLGVNSGGSITFATDNPTPVIEMARRNAMEQAIAKAKTLTQSAGVGLGRILEITEGTRQMPRPIPMARMEAAVAKDMAVPIARGENAYSVTVNVRWELDQ